MAVFSALDLCQAEVDLVGIALLLECLPSVPNFKCWVHHGTHLLVHLVCFNFCLYETRIFWIIRFIHLIHVLNHLVPSPYLRKSDVFLTLHFCLTLQNNSLSEKGTLVNAFTLSSKLIVFTCFALHASFFLLHYYFFLLVLGVLQEDRVSAEMFGRQGQGYLITTVTIVTHGCPWYLSLTKSDILAVELHLEKHA